MEEQTIPAPVRKYLEEILQASGLGESSEKEALLDELYAEFNAFMTTIISAALSKQEAEEFAVILRDQGDEAVQAYLYQHIPNAGAVFNRGVQMFRTRCLGENSKKETEGN
jgi:hypothetical protein